jgi:hypothetical protein
MNHNKTMIKKNFLNKKKELMYNQRLNPISLDQEELQYRQKRDIKTKLYNIGKEKVLQ